jgi:predicted metal-dependent phosphoesterase TrpH
MDVLKVDLHLHTSDDPEDVIHHDARTLIDRAAASGFDALAITLHNRQFVDPDVSDYARDRAITLLPGVEQTIEGRHVLLINFPQAAEEVRTFEALAALKRGTNGIVIAPHAFFPHRSCLRACLERHANLFDAVEWSYFWTRGVNFNAQASRWAREHGKTLVGNSDLHDLRQLGVTYSHVSAARDPEAICEAIREGHVTVQTAPVPVLRLAQVLAGMGYRGRSFRKRRRVPVPAPDPAIHRAST